MRDILSTTKDNCCGTVEIFCPCPKKDLDNLVRFLYYGEILYEEKSDTKKIFENLKEIFGFSENLSLNCREDTENDSDTLSVPDSKAETETEDFPIREAREISPDWGNSELFSFLKNTNPVEAEISLNPKKNAQISEKTSSKPVPSGSEPKKSITPVTTTQLEKKSSKSEKSKISSSDSKCQKTLGKKLKSDKIRNKSVSPVRNNSWMDSQSTDSEASSTSSHFEPVPTKKSTETTSKKSTVSKPKSGKKPVISDSENESSNEIEKEKEFEKFVSQACSQSGSTLEKSKEDNLPLQEKRSEKKSEKKSGRKRKKSETTWEDGQVFTAETILGKRIAKGGKYGIEYLVKWHGYTHEHNTWEPEENILDQGLIDEFDSRNTNTEVCIYFRFRVPIINQSNAQISF